MAQPPTAQQQKLLSSLRSFDRVGDRTAYTPYNQTKHWYELERSSEDFGFTTVRKHVKQNRHASENFHRAIISRTNRPWPRLLANGGHQVTAEWQMHKYYGNGGQRTIRFHSIEANIKNGKKLSRTTPCSVEHRRGKFPFRQTWGQFGDSWNH